MASRSFIDTHIHVIPNSYRDAIAAAGGDPSGFPVPSWSIGTCLEFVNSVDIQHAVLSVTSPGPSIAGNGIEGRALARTLNDEVATIADNNPGRISFFASTPDWTDVQGTLDELDYIFSTQKKALGVIVMTTYGDRLLGDALFQPIWKKLDDYKAIVFIHPTWYDIKPKYIAGNLPQPLIEYPFGTTRTAADLLMTGRFGQCPNIDIILSHAGGVLPYLATRLSAILLAKPFSSDGGKTVVTMDDFQQNLKRFYMDLALSGSLPQLEALIAFESTDRLLFGSDYPYASVPGSKLNTASLVTYAQNNPKGHLVNASKLTNNTLALFKKHGFDLGSFNSSSSL
ncbi:hypothetical protein BDA99DRAFT_533214 [Phascolomyces articulosus]|uniref:6-methylsalicylate decarboxylase n=1 Tax=Phascolomyces articulosus TaxID=60185 RepID=A0AAD5KLB0_9FUNG|nr:hypothetical protein BDA99DRAFT_533214 [Phascolomyces articulosus]